MSRRGRSKSPFSLFSFQDIITSVTGIIILLMLILAVELVQRKTRGGAETRREVYKDVREALATASTELAALQTGGKQELAVIEQAAGVVPEQMRLDQSETEQQLARLKREGEELERRQARVRDEEKRALSRSFERGKDREELQQREVELDSTRAKIHALREQNRLIFNQTSGTGKTPWLVDISGQRFVVGKLPQQNNADPPRGTVYADSAPLLRFVRSCDRQSEYFVLLVRPSGINAFVELLDAMQNMGFELGFDVIGHDSTIFSVGEEGAAP